MQYFIYYKPYYSLRGNKFFGMEVKPSLLKDLPMTKGFNVLRVNGSEEEFNRLENMMKTFWDPIADVGVLDDRRDINDLLDYIRGTKRVKPRDADWQDRIGDYKV
jgi:hypothetical protein